MNNNTVKPLPRRDLREEAFRKYEPFIARAVKGRTNVVLSEMEMRASTFVARMRDAIRGYRLYGYTTTMWSPKETLEFSFVEMSDGSVDVVSKHIATVPTESIPVFSEESILAHCKAQSGVTKKWSITEQRQIEWLLKLETQFDVGVRIDGDVAHVLS